MARAPLVADAELLPESDRLEGFESPRETKVLYGHAAAERTLAEALASGKMHHAWLVTGTEGIGKATLCYRAARAALARDDERGMFASGLDIEPGSATARQVQALSHPGLVVIRRAYDTKAKRFSASISVDEVRRLRNFLSLSAEAQGWRAVIVDSADDLNVNAANALLKSLEEPPPRTVFLLVSSAPGRLLATIRSRCRTLPLQALGLDDLKAAASAALAAAGKPAMNEDDYRALEPLAEGSPRRLLALMEGGGLAYQAKIESFFAALPKFDAGAAHALSDELQPAAQEQKFELFYELLFAYLARLIRAGATGQGSGGDAVAAKRLMGGAKLATFAQL
ncbi:MAG: DNA polymerase III subunit delta', partial [Hyphomicrobium sp.]